MVQIFRLEFVTSIACMLFCARNISQLLPAIFCEKSQLARALDSALTEGCPMVQVCLDVAGPMKICSL